jgi:hypothetical protein
MLIANDKNDKRKQNQLYSAYFVIFILLFKSTFSIWCYINFYDNPYERIVATPLTAEVKPDTIGEFVIFSNLTHSLWLFK